MQLGDIELPVLYQRLRRVRVGYNQAYVVDNLRLSDPTRFGITFTSKTIARYFVERGWIAEGCGDYRSVNRTLFVAGAAFPGTSLWLYGANDSFYSLAHSRTNFDSFSAAGGLGAFNKFTRAPGLNGHFLINDPQLWEVTMDDFLGQL